MASYTKATDFASKDALLTGDPNKIVKGSEIDDEFANIQTAVNSKADTNSPALTGTPTAPTAGGTTNTTQVATTAMVQAAIAANATGVNISGGDINLGIGTFGTTNWTWYESSGVLYFEYGGTKKMKIDSSGNLTVVGNITAYGTV